MQKLNPLQLNKLYSQWGDRAESMDVKAWVRYYDISSDWSCYIYAINPEMPDQFHCLAGRRGYLIPALWSFDDLLACYDKDGESPPIDPEYRPKQVTQLLKENYKL